MVLAILPQQYLFVICFEYYDRYDVKIADVTHRNSAKERYRNTEGSTKVPIHIPNPPPPHNN